MRIGLTLANFIATTLRFSEKLEHPFSRDFYLVTCFLRVTVAMPVTSCINDTRSNLSVSNKSKETKLFELRPVQNETPSHRKHMIPNLKTREN